jgi:hypothetical protein
MGLRWDPDNLGHDLADLMRELILKWTFLDFRHTFGRTDARYDHTG